MPLFKLILTYSSCFIFILHENDENLHRHANLPIQRMTRKLINHMSRNVRLFLVGTYTFLKFKNYKVYHCNFGLLVCTTSLKNKKNAQTGRYRHDPGKYRIMTCFEAQTAIVSPSEDQPGTEEFSALEMPVCWLGAELYRMRSGSRLCFHQTFYLLFPHSNCYSWSYTDRFGLRNINSKIEETNRQQQC